MDAVIRKVRCIKDDPDGKLENAIGKIGYYRLGVAVLGSTDVWAASIK